MLLVKAGSGVATLGIPGSPGVPKPTVADTLVAQFNNLDSIESLCQAHREDIAAIIVEPFVGNSGFIRPKPGFLAGLRKICDQHNAVLIIDEVMTGFRVALGGAQSIEKVQPDLTTFGKVVGGGMPIGAYGGKRAIMEYVAPIGPMYQAGTLSGNPLATIAGLKTLEILQKEDYSALAKSTKTLCDGLEAAAEKHGIPFQTDYEGGMFGFFFHPSPISNFEEATQANQDHFKQFFWGMMDKGIYLAPSAFEAGFVGFSHTSDDINKTIEAADQVFGQIKE